MLANIFRSRKLDKQLSNQRPRLYRLANSWCGDKMLADDLVQDTLSKALLKQDQLKDFSRMEAWLYRILHNCWMEYLRTNKPTTDIDELTLSSEESPEKRVVEQQIKLQVRKTVEMLPLTQRQVITLVDLEGCSYAEVTEILDIPMGTVMSRLNRARKMLKEQLMHVHHNHKSHSHLRRVK